MIKILKLINGEEIIAKVSAGTYSFTEYGEGIPIGEESDSRPVFILEDPIRIEREYQGGQHRVYLTKWCPLAEEPPPFIFTDEVISIPLEPIPEVIELYQEKLSSFRVLEERKKPRDERDPNYIALLNFNPPDEEIQ